MEPNKENKLPTMPLIAGGVVILIIILLATASGSKENTQSMEDTKDTAVVVTPTNAMAPTESVTPTETTTSMVDASNVKTFTVTAANFSYDLKEIKVNKGDTVKLLVKNAEGFHDLVIDEFNVKSAKLNAGSEETLQFVADKTGSFVYYCSVGTHRAMGMWGTLTVM